MCFLVRKSGIAINAVYIISFHAAQFKRKTWTIKIIAFNLWQQEMFTATKVTAGLVVGWNHICASLIFQMETSCICEICNATSIISYIFSPQIRLKLATQAPSSIVFLMRRPKGFINEEHNQAKTWQFTLKLAVFYFLHYCYPKLLRS